jgi:serine/threonine protein kinase
MIADHPGWEKLQAYGQGRLAPEAAAAVEEHLSGCANCCERLEQAPGDSFLNRLRAVGASARGRSLSTDSSEVTLADAPPIPLELVDHPRYRVLGLVGQGGMGAVYRAEHRRMERLVALKVIHPRFMKNPSVVQRFHQEVRAAARLHHPNIVTAHDADQAGGLHFLVMEYVEGTSLADLVNRSPLPAAEACEYIRQAALGLQHAHEQGMVHRDIKPHNLMLQTSGEALMPGRHGRLVKILDFGLARLQRTTDVPASGNDLAPALTGAGAVMGTADYIAPEQAADPRAADIRADIYSLGCSLFHLMTGRPPFPNGTVVEKLAQHATTPAPAVNSVFPEVQSELAAVTARMMAKAPADRYATPAEVAEALLPFCPPSGQPPTAGDDSGISLARKRRLFTAGLVLAAMLLAGGLWRFAASRDEGAEPKDDLPIEEVKGEEVRPAAPRNKDSEPTIPEKGSQVLVEEEEAVQAVKALKGRIRRGRKVPGNPYTGLWLNGARITDADLHLVLAFTQLRTLHLGRTRVTDEGVKRLTSLPHLTSLMLPDTKVTNAGMKHIGEMKHLQALELNTTQVGDDGLKHLVGLTKLRTLGLSRARVTDAGMIHIGRLPGLAILNLDHTAITDAGLKNLTDLPRLSNLGLFSARGITDEGMKTVAQMKRLMSLDLAGTRVTDQGLQELARCVRFASLRLGGLKVTDAGVKSLSRMSKLMVLDLSRTDVTDEGLKEVARFRGLTNLTLDGARKITDAGVKQLAKLPRLQHLTLANTDVTDVGVAELARLPQLRSLVLAGTGVTDASLKELARCPQLASLTLREANKLTEAGVAELRKARPDMLILR